MASLRERFNSISHMVGGGVAIAAFPLLIVKAHGALATVAVTIYGTSLILLYAMSTVYHSVRHPRAEPWLLRLDHSLIYLLIAGTYSPVALLLLGGTSGWVLFIVEWALSITGIVLSLTVHGMPKWINQVLYQALGWAAVIALPNLLSIPWQGLALLAGGGIVYTSGAVLYGRNRAHSFGPIGDHEVWHLMVILGSALHFVFVLFYVL